MKTTMKQTKILEIKKDQETVVAVLTVHIITSIQETIALVEIIQSTII
jgi:hypothetical protein